MTKKLLKLTSPMQPSIAMRLNIQFNSWLNVLYDGIPVKVS